MSSENICRKSFFKKRNLCKKAKKYTNFIITIDKSKPFDYNCSPF
ncbi:hypothetical protein MNB_SV-10-501 [hydrothermal vent metagenome]|uniref:Uncharacterized protein n=1 Tax=hydrothermal vent metagenome TaxID=652676 RepID=A0A1W1BUN4_9ZZZZ